MIPRVLHTRKNIDPDQVSAEDQEFVKNLLDTNHRPLGFIHATDERRQCANCEWFDRRDLPLWAGCCFIDPKPIMIQHAHRKCARHRFQTKPTDGTPACETCRHWGCETSERPAAFRILGATHLISEHPRVQQVRVTGMVVSYPCTREGPMHLPNKFPIMEDAEVCSHWEMGGYWEEEDDDEQELPL